MKMNKVVAAIPARLGSSRFPNKILFSLKGRPLIYHVWNEARKIKGIDRLVVVTDDNQIIKAVESFGGEAIKSSSRPHTGSDRIAEVMAKIPAEIYVNIQGDNLFPFARPVSSAITKFKKGKSSFGTLAFRLDDDSELFNPSHVKVVLDAKKRAAWFSRYPIPYIQKPTTKKRASQAQFLGHMGIYLYTAEALQQYARWKRTDAEKAESLEQLRILEQGGEMSVYLSKVKPVSVDTPADIHKIQLQPRIR